MTPTPESSTDPSQFPAQPQTISPAPPADTTATGMPPPAPTGFTCSWEPGCTDAAWVNVTGELDIATAPQLRRTLGQAQLAARVVVLDLRELTFIDSSGIHVVLDSALSAQGRLILVRGCRQVDRMLTLTGVQGLLTILDLDPGEPAARALLHLDD